MSVNYILIPKWNVKNKFILCQKHHGEKSRRDSNVKPRANDINKNINALPSGREARGNNANQANSENVVGRCIVALHLNRSLPTNLTIIVETTSADSREMTGLAKVGSEINAVSSWKAISTIL